MDFDNTYKGEKLYNDNPGHISIEKILNYCKNINFESTFIYTTFSNSEKQTKFRLAYVFEEPITEYLLASQIPQKLLEIIERLIGRENISHVTLQDFVSNRFSVSEIKGKLVNIVSEMTKEFLKDSSVFKQIVTGDIITVEEKFKDRYTIKPYAKHILQQMNCKKLQILVMDISEDFL